MLALLVAKNRVLSDGAGFGNAGVEMGWIAAICGSVAILVQYPYRESQFRRTVKDHAQLATGDEWPGDE